jgi:hypothetical protein
MATENLRKAALAINAAAALLIAAGTVLVCTGGRA